MDEKDFEDGAARQEEMRRTSQMVYGFNDGGHADCWCDKEEC